MKKLPVSKVTHWNAPPKNDVRLLGMPNIFDALQGPGCQPRTIVGSRRWDEMRKKCYEDAGYKCEICGFQAEPGKGQLHSHEVFSTDYVKGVAKFERLVCICPLCHLRVIHSGRALTFYKHGDPLYSKERLLEGAEHGFKLIAEYNKTHKRKIKVFSTIATYTNEPELRDDMLKLIDKYHIEFYGPISGKKQAPWSEWKMVWNGKEYPTPYKDHADYEQKMREMNKKQDRFGKTNRMKGGVFDELDKLLKEGE